MSCKEVMVSEAARGGETYRLVEEFCGDIAVAYSIMKVIKYSGGYEDLLAVGKQLHVGDGNNIESALCRFDEFLHEIGWVGND